MAPDTTLRALLDERARHLAGRVPPGRSAGEVAAMVAFDVGPERFLVPAASVAEVLAGPRWTPLPGVPKSIDGVVAVRGNVIPLVRLDRVLSRNATADEVEAPAASIVLAGLSLALRADRLLGIQSGAQRAISPLPEGSPPELQSIARGIADDRVVLDPGRLADYLVTVFGESPPPTQTSIL